MNHQTNFKNFDNYQANSKKISCDGGSLSSKHPLIFLNFGNNENITCPYCGKVFSQEKSSKHNIKNSKNNHK